MIIKDTLHILFRRVQPETVIKSWLESKKGDTNQEPMFMLPNKGKYNIEKTFDGAIQTEFDHYTFDEANYAFNYAKDYELNRLGDFKDFGVFGLVAKSVEDMLITDNSNECLCKYKELLNFRKLTHTIDPTIFIAAFLARFDVEHGFERNAFSWNPVIRAENANLQSVLNKGMSENHFHIGGSSNAFMFSWICLMNHFTPERKSDFENDKIKNEALDTIYAGTLINQDSNYLLTFKALCIRCFFYTLLKKENKSKKRCIEKECDVSYDEKYHNFNDAWLIKMLSLNEDDCSLEMNDVNSHLLAMRALCSPVDSSGFIPDYALDEEPISSLYSEYNDCRPDVAVRNYERKLFRPLAGEQRFLYKMFRAIFEKNSSVESYLDVFYAYLLIYCRLRGELIQANTRVGFGNFLKYQDRKEIFTKYHSSYTDMRTGIAERAVLENPQISSFEGRFIPAETAEKMIDNVNWFISRGTRSICGVSDYINNETNEYLNEEKFRDKLHFVIHFAKQAQPIEDSEEKELICPRDNKLRAKTIRQADAFIKARIMKPDIMKFITGMDACSSEIDCRPEVFACAIRKITQSRNEADPIVKSQLPVMHITYHAGEDFLDPLSGLRAIDEAICLLKMKSGDRLGHALALGIDCEEWYTQKNHIILIRAQELIDNLAWLYGKMNFYGIENNSAKEEIKQKFKEYFTKIYKKNKESCYKMIDSIDIDDYYRSLSLRGNFPELYINNPETESIQFKEVISEALPWQIVEKSADNSDPMSNLLYHYYHFNFKMKKASDEITRYNVPKSIEKAVCALQEKMQYELANKGIAIECNPSSNFLIGTFKDYLKHPIFKFNNANLYSPDDPRFSSKNPHLSVSINTDDLGIFDTSLENEYALLASALESNNDFCEDNKIPVDNIYRWLDGIRDSGRRQSFKK